MRRRELLAVLGVGLAGCTSRDPLPGTEFPVDPPTDSPTDAPTPADGERPTATARDPESLDASGSWPQFGADAGHTGVTANAGVPGDAEPYWHLRRIRSGPVVLADGRLFGYAKLGADTSGEPTITRTREQPGTAHPVYGEPHLLARDASDGTIEWAVPLGPVAGWPAVADGRVVVGARGRLAAFGASRGQLLWERDLGDRSVGNPTLAGDAVVVPIQGSVDGRTGEMIHEPGVRVHDLDGSRRWAVRPPKRGNGVAVADDTVVVVSYGWDGTGVVLGLSLADGAETWRVETAGDFFENPVVADGTVYLASSEGYVRALSLADGSERWRRTFDDRPSRVAADAESAFVATGETLTTLDAADGSVRWTTATGRSGEEYFVTPAVGGGTVYAGAVGVDAHLFAFDAGDGTERWSHRFPNTVVEGDIVTSGLEAQPTVADGAVYAYAADGLYAFGPRE